MQLLLPVPLHHLPASAELGQVQQRVGLGRRDIVFLPQTRFQIQLSQVAAISNQTAQRYLFRHPEASFRFYSKI